MDQSFLTPLQRLSIVTKRLKPSKVDRLLNFAEALEQQQVGKQQAKAKAHSQRGTK